MAVSERAPQPLFKFHKTYLKDVSYEGPGAPGVFADPKPQEVSVQFNVRHAPLEDDLHEVTLTVRVESRQGKAASFLVELQQAGVFEISGLPEADVSRILEVSCADMLMGFAREAVCDLVVKGGFPQLLIDPVNFQLVYEQKQRALRERSAPGG